MIKFWTYKNISNQTKSESENILIDVKDFELKLTSEKVLTRGDSSIGESVSKQPQENWKNWIKRSHQQSINRKLMQSLSLLVDKIRWLVQLGFRKRSKLLKTPVIKKTLRKNDAQQKAIMNMADTCVTEPKVDTIIGNVGVDDSMNNLFGLTEMLKMPAVNVHMVKSIHGLLHGMQNWILKGLFNR